MKSVYVVHNCYLDGLAYAHLFMEGVYASLEKALEDHPTAQQLGMRSSDDGETLARMMRDGKFIIERVEVIE